jgi:hypothetical protein
MAVKLLDDISTDTVGSAFKTDGGSKTFHCWGTFGSGTVSLEASSDGTNWTVLSISGTAAEFTTAKVAFIERLGQGMHVRASLSGSSGASGVNAWLHD